MSEERSRGEAVEKWTFRDWYLFYRRQYEATQKGIAEAQQAAEHLRTLMNWARRFDRADQRRQAAGQFA